MKNMILVKNIKVYFDLYIPVDWARAVGDFLMAKGYKKTSSSEFEAEYDNGIDASIYVQYGMPEATIESVCWHLNIQNPAEIFAH